MEGSRKKQAITFLFSQNGAKHTHFKKPWFGSDFLIGTVVSAGIERAPLRLGSRWRLPPGPGKGWGQFSLDTLEGGGDGEPEPWVKAVAPGSEALAVQAPREPPNRPPDYAGETWALPSQPSQHWRLKLSFLPPGPAWPHWQQFPPIRSVAAPQTRLPSADWMGREPGPRVPIWEPLTQPHTQAQVRPPSPFPSPSPAPSPTPRALAEAYRPGRCPSTGPASRASGPAPTWRRRSGRTGGGGAPTGPFRAGGQGEGVGEGEALSRWPPAPRGVRRGSRRGCRRLRAALLTTTRTWKAAAPESDPRSLTLRRVPGAEAIRAKQAAASNTATRQKPSAPPSKLWRRSPPPSPRRERARSSRLVVSRGAPPTGFQQHLFCPPRPGRVPP